MSLPRHAKYRDSGVEWLGEVPDRWEIAPLRRVGSEREDANVGLLETNLLSLSYGSIVRKDIATQEGLLPVSFETYQIVHLGDVVFRLTDLQNDKRSLRTALVRERGIITFAYIAFKPENVSPPFLAYLLRDYDLRKIFYSMGGGVRQSMKYQDVRDLPVLVPSVEEQSAITAFLDQETGKIDGLIEEQRRLIGLLKEKRQAVISLAVTKGLDPSVPMRNSGTEWFGAVPEHWRVGRCGRHIRVLSGFAFPSERFSHHETDVKLLRGVNVGVGEIRWKDVVYWHRGPDEGLNAFALTADELVIGMDRPLISDGVRVARVQADDLPCLLLQRVAALRTDGQLSSEYFEYLLGSEMFVAHFSPETTGVSVPHISPEQIASFMIPLPPRYEQTRICEYIREQVARTKELSSAAERAINLLQERRSALISAAVTGKIDVRNYVPPETAAPRGRL